MTDEFGPNFITITDEDGNDIELEYVDALEHNGTTYMAFVPADMDEDDEDFGLILLKVIEENGEEILADIDDQQELDAVYEQFMTELFDEDEEEEN